MISYFCMTTVEQNTSVNRVSPASNDEVFSVETNDAVNQLLDAWAVKKAFHNAMSLGAGFRALVGYVVAPGSVEAKTYADIVSLRTRAANSPNMESNTEDKKAA